jgi:hypothetical protein
VRSIFAGSNFIGVLSQLAPIATDALGDVVAFALALAIAPALGATEPALDEPGLTVAVPQATAANDSKAQLSQMKRVIE